MAELLDVLGIETVAVMGTSGGGMALSTGLELGGTGSASAPLRMCTAIVARQPVTTCVC